MISTFSSLLNLSISIKFIFVYLSYKVQIRIRSFNLPFSENILRCKCLHLLVKPPKETKKGGISNIRVSSTKYVFYADGEYVSYLVCLPTHILFIEFLVVIDCSVTSCIDCRELHRGVQYFSIFFNIYCTDIFADGISPLLG